MELKGVCTTEEMVNWTLAQSIEWRKIIASCVSDRELIYRIDKEPQIQTSWKQITQKSKSVVLNKTFSTEVKTAAKHP